MDFDHNFMETQKKPTWFMIKKTVVVVGIFSVLITTIPYLLGYFVQNDQYIFSGFLFGVEDGNSYIAKMLLGSEGDWLFRSPYSAVNQNGIFAFITYIVLGKLAAGAGFHAQLISLFHLYRILGIFFLVYVYARYFFLYFNNKKIIYLGLTLVLFGAGWDWLILFWGVDRIPISFYSPETFGFLSIYGLPHLCFSRGFMLLGILELLQWDYSHKTRPFLLTGLYFLAASIFQPLNLVIAYTVFGVWWVILLFLKKFSLTFELFFKQALTVFISLPTFIYYFWIVKADPFMAQWTAQNILHSPPLIDYILAFGPLLLFLILEILVFRTAGDSLKDERKILLFVWVAVSFILVYLPLNVQRRLMDGVWLANVLLFIPIINKIKSKAVVALFILSMMITPIFLLTGSVLSVINPIEPQFVDKSKLALYDELRLIAEPNAVVLAPFEISTEIPAYGKLRVVTGHGPESIMKEQTDAFLTDLYAYQISHRRACEFINQHMINYVWYDAKIYDEAKIQSIFNNNEFKLVIDFPETKVIKIQQCDP